ncbi:MAG: xanthine dehydrogenase family protein molybdopterin-binding subunit [Acidimicrobiales bacterium]|nr:xanthine dehydrogenase family protein molybdopterin-binding subunit [Acidimicrobiales bacterium]
MSLDFTDLEVGRGEEKLVGSPYRRLEDPIFITKGATYVGDLEFDDIAHISFVRSPVASANLKNVDVSEALGQPGVIAAFTAKDIEIPAIINWINKVIERPFLAKDKLRFVGEAVAMVIGETKAFAEDACEFVNIDYDLTTPIIDPRQSANNEVSLFEGCTSNIVASIEGGQVAQIGEVRIEAEFVNQRLAPCPMEGRAVVATIDGEMLTVYISNQAPHSAKRSIIRYLSIDEGNLRVITPDVGGGFGSKIGTYPEEILVPYIARKLNRTCRWVETRSESMVSLGHGRGQIAKVTLGGDRDGKIRSYCLSVIQDCGAYPEIGANMPALTRWMTSGCYDIDSVDFNSISVLTNTNPTVAYRGAGRPEAAYAIERAVDMFATEIGMDKAEVRFKNFIDPKNFPYQTKVGSTYDCGNYEESLRRVLKLANYDELLVDKENRIKDKSDLLLGIGISSYVEITHGFPAKEFGSVELISGGKLSVKVGTLSHGQGHRSAISMIVRDVTGVDPCNIDFYQGDTELIESGVGTFGSRSMQSGGVACKRAADMLVTKAMEFLSNHLDVDLDKVEFSWHEGGQFSVGSMCLSWSDLYRLAKNEGKVLKASENYESSSPTFPFGAHLAVVEVDVETGKVHLRDMFAIDDAGNILNPLLAKGQIHGGLAQGISQALYEEFIYDQDGNPLTATFADYGFPTAAEFPQFRDELMQTPTSVNELGVKGIGESGTIGATPAVVNAVMDALSVYGISHIDMPLSPEKVFSAIKIAKRSK